MLGRVRRGQFSERPHNAASTDQPQALPEAPAGWDYTARATVHGSIATEDDPPALRAQILSLYADPRIHWLSTEEVIQLVGRPRQDVETTVDAMIQSGELHVEGTGNNQRIRVSDGEKRQLEVMFRDAAQDLGEQGVLAHRPDAEALATFDDETEEPRLPVTAGLLSLFLPGTGQLLNGDVGRASLVFAVWSLAWITHLSPVWTFVCLYAGAEAFFTAKIRSMERKLNKDALPAGGTPPQLPPPKPTST